jgi:hypothetical protein
MKIALTPGVHFLEVPSCTRNDGARIDAFEEFARD